jgi:hypothetical protein
MELNGCFCGSVLNSSTASVIECKRTGCETRWVSKISCYSTSGSVLLSFFCSTIWNALWMTQSQRIGFAMLVKCRGKDEAASVHADDVRLLYIDMCLIT